MRAAVLALALLETGCGSPPPPRVGCELLVPTPVRQRCQAAQTCGRINWEECGQRHSFFCDYCEASTVCRAGSCEALDAGSP